MAFNFNWSPLIADTSRAREMLTAALNKSPKPPIIVDDIIVTELNLGETPPNLEILEIGDLAEDRFRGIFKMSYAGDAFLTLKTRVQANPLNTYLSTKPDFASPEPLAAASGLTIPLAITLSDIRLSGFVILVFSRQKGMTLVFRNDPLESLKVSSTFDSIPFVRDYLQREIEKQLRNLFMEDLPAILHRLSLRMWSPEYRELDDRLGDKADESTIPVDPLHSPPQDPVDWLNTVFGESQIPSYSLDSATETHASFSQKNLLRLAALSDSHRTLSLFTPPMRDTVFRAWTEPNEKGTSGLQSPQQNTPTISRMSSYLGSATSSTMSDAGSDSRVPSSATSYTFHGSTSSHNGRPRKAKKRVIDLRKKTDVEATPSEAGTDSITPEPSIAPSSAPSVIYEERDGDVITPPRTPREGRFDRRRASSVGNSPEATPRASIVLPKKASKEELVQPPAYTLPEEKSVLEKKASSKKRPALLSSTKTFPSNATPSSSSATQNNAQTPPSRLLRSLSTDKMAFSPSEGSTGGILEQAWMMKMANEIAKKVREEQSKEERKWTENSRAPRASIKRREADVDARSEDGLSDAPPAYAF